MRDDEEDFSTLYRSSRERLASQIHGLTGDRAEAVEVVQEAFARAWVRWSSVRSFDDPEAWVRKVAFRLAVSRWRRLQRVIPGPAARIDGPTVEEAGDRVDVVRALTSLPINQRQAVVLHHLGGLSVEEIATEMGRPAGTVKSWLSRGRRRLAEQLDESPAEAALDVEGAEKR